MGQFKQLKRSLAKRGAMVGRTVVEAPIRYTSEQQITNVQTGQSFPVTVHYGPNALPPRNLVKIGWKDEGDEGPIVGFFSDGSKGRMEIWNLLARSTANQFRIIPGIHENKRSNSPSSLAFH